MEAKNWSEKLKRKFEFLENVKKLREFKRANEILSFQLFSLMFWYFHSLHFSVVTTFARWTTVLTEAPSSIKTINKESWTFHTSKECFFTLLLICIENGLQREEKKMSFDWLNEEKCEVERERNALAKIFLIEEIKEKENRSTKWKKIVKNEV